MKAFRAGVALLALVAAGGACDRGVQPTAGDSALPEPDSATAARAHTSMPGWVPDLGPLVAVRVDSTSGLILHGDIDVVSEGTTTVQLVTPDGRAAPAEITATRSDGPSCQLINLAAAPAEWSLAVAGTSRVTPVVGSAAFERADSLTFARELTRLASVVPNDSSGRFVGLPFVVARMWTATAHDSTPLLIGRLRRQVNQEASPLEEQTFVVAELRSGGWISAYSDRSIGLEETVETRDAAALLTSNGRTILLVTRDFGSGSSLALLERGGGGGGGGGWSLRFSGSRRQCQ